MYRMWYKNEEREPKFCTKCKRELTSVQLNAGYDAYTGEESFKDYLACPFATKSLSDSHHDVWEIMAANESYPPFTVQNY